MEKNKTKIIATIGPATTDENMLLSLIRAGVNVCRINASHGDTLMHRQVIERVRKINKAHKKNVAILFDLQGPKLRIGEIENIGVEIEDGNELTLTTEKIIGNKKIVSVQYESICKDVKVGEIILIDDGKIALEVKENDGIKNVLTKVIHGGMLSSKKGLNLPHTKVSLPSLTEKDKKDLAFAMEQNIEWIGLSFVRRALDIIELKKLINDSGKTSRVVAKIEKPEALHDIVNIIAEADAVMVARGDLGVEMPMEQVPLIQKMLVKKCLAASKPVIIATQMMESMIFNFRPTRAEVNDVGNSVLDGADAVMLSAETSVGKYPVETVDAMKKIILTTEMSEEIYYRENPPVKSSRSFISDSVSYNACLMAQQCEAKAMVVMTHSGYTALRIAGQRPKANIYVFTDNSSLLNTLSLVWNVEGFYYDNYTSTDHTISEIKKFLFKHDYVDKGDIIIHVSSTPIFEKGTSNTIKLNVVN